VDAGVRKRPSERTAYIFLPGGIGTLDEVSEVMTLVQLNKLGTNLPLPMVLVNYDGFYDDVFQWLRVGGGLLLLLLMMMI
jgi:predicted Rossmann-fold nucleotide-binding protein